MDRKRWKYLKVKIQEENPISILLEEALEEIEADLYITDEERQEEDVKVDYSHFYVKSDTWRCEICGRGMNNPIHTKE